MCPETGDIAGFEPARVDLNLRGRIEDFQVIVSVPKRQACSAPCRRAQLEARCLGGIPAQCDLAEDPDVFLFLTVARPREDKAIPERRTEGDPVR